MRLLRIFLLSTVVALVFWIPGVTLTEKMAWLEAFPDRIEKIISVQVPEKKNDQPKATTVSKNIVPRQDPVNVGPAAKTEPKTEQAQIIHARDTKSLQMERAIFDVINQERQRLGLKPFVWDEKVAELARLKSIEAFEIKLATHKSPKYGYAVDMYEKYGIAYRMGSGVLAFGTAGFFDAKSIGLGWFESPSHREILVDDFTHMGVGLAWVEQPVVLRDDVNGGEGRAVFVVNALVYTPK